MHSKIILILGETKLKKNIGELIPPHPSAGFRPLLAAHALQQPDAAVRGGEPLACGHHRHHEDLHAADRGQPGPAPLRLRLLPRRQQLQPGEIGRGAGNECYRESSTPRCNFNFFVKVALREHSFFLKDSSPGLAQVAKIARNLLQSRFEQQCMERASCVLLCVILLERPFSFLYF